MIPQDSEKVITPLNETIIMGQGTMLPLHDQGYRGRLHELQSEASTPFLHVRVLGRCHLTYIVLSTLRKVVFLLNSCSLRFCATPSLP